MSPTLSGISIYMEVKMFYVIVISDFEAWVPQCSILGLLLFLIYVSDLSENLVSNNNVFADDFSVFSVFKNIDNSGINLDNNSWIFQWKMIFNFDPMKEDLESFFSQKPIAKQSPCFFIKFPLPKLNCRKI